MKKLLVMATMGLMLTTFTMPVLAADKNAAVDSLSLGVGADETEIYVNWYSKSANAGTVQWAKKADMTGEDFPQKHMEAAAVTAAAENKSGYYSNKVALTGLEANTQYVYRVGNDGSWSEIYDYDTENFDGGFSFLLAGDPQIGAGSQASDQKGWEDTLNKAMTQFPESSFLISAGDQVNTNNNESQYTSYLAPEELKSLPIATNVGNHDTKSNAYSEHFNIPNVDQTTVTAGEFSGDYWYKYDDVLFMSINSNDRSTAKHKQFLEDTVAAQGSDAKWKVVTFHHSVYSTASHTQDSDIIQRRNELPPVFSDLGIDAVLMGHDHVYTRTYMMNGTNPVKTDNVESQVVNPAEGEVLYLTANSASGSKFYSIMNYDYPFAAVKNQESVPNITNVKVTDTSMQFTTYRTSDMSLVDDFTIYKGVDANGDYMAPVITTPDNDTVILGKAFDPLEGVTAIDNKDGDITGKIKVEGTVDINKVGQYTLTYTVSDTAGNETKIVRTITVLDEDKTAPELNVPAATELYTGDEFDPMDGITATDERDGDITKSVTVEGSADTQTPGTYELTYRVSDAAGNETVKKRIVTVKESTTEETTLITTQDTIWRYLDNNTDPAENLESRTAWTEESFDDSVWSTAKGSFGAKKGQIADLGGGCTPNTLLTQYIEGTKDDIPTYFFRTTFDLEDAEKVVGMTGSLMYDDAAIVYINGVKAASYYEPEGGFESNMSYGGSNKSSPLNGTFQLEDWSMLKDGVNTIAVEIHNGRIDSSDVYFDFLDLTVTTEKEIADTISPVISFPEKTEIYVGDVFDPMAGVSASDNADGDVTADIQVQGKVDVSSPGTTELVYTVTDKAGNKGEAVRKITVMEKEQPVVPDKSAPVLNIPASTVITVGSKFDKMQGVSAKDDRDGDITAKVTCTGEVDSSKPGTYTLTYRVSDKAGNTVTQQRTVIVKAAQQGTDKPAVVKASGVKLNHSSITIQKGKKYTWLKAAVTPKNTTNKKLTWSSSNKKVAAINAKGVVTAKKEGTANIKVKTANGKKDTVKVNVVDRKIKVSKISMDKKARMYRGTKLELDAAVKPVNASKKKVSWSTSNSKIATVSPKGVVKAKKTGTVKITCTAKDGSGKKAVCSITVVSKKK